MWPLLILAFITVLIVFERLIYYAFRLFKKKTDVAARQLMLVSVSYITLLQIIYVADKFIR